MTDVSRAHKKTKGEIESNLGAGGDHEIA